MRRWSGSAAARGLAVLCQKPLAPTLAAAEALVAAVGGAVPLMVHENWRFRAYYRRLREWLDDGHGSATVRQVQLDFLSSGMIPDDDGKRPALVRQPFLAGLERLLVMEILIHHLDTLRFLLGELDGRRGAARADERGHARRGRGGDRAAPGGGRRAGVRDRQPRGARARRRCRATR